MVSASPLLAALLATSLLGLDPVLAREQAPWAAVAALGAQSAPKRYFGTWRLNPARSTQRAEPSPYKRVTTRIGPWEDGLKVTYDMVGVRGGVTHLEWTGRFDGRDYPMHGVDYVLTNAYRPIDDRSYEIVIKVDGQRAATAVAVVSPDGQTLTVTTTERDATGQTVQTTAVYDRQ